MFLVAYTFSTLELFKGVKVFDKLFRSTVQGHLYTEVYEN